MERRFGWYVNLDERGSFQADVRDAEGRTVFEVRAGDELGEGETSIFEDGFMRDKHDVDGLQEYLRELKVIPADGEILEMAAFEAALEAEGGPAP